MKNLIFLLIFCISCITEVQQFKPTSQIECLFFSPPEESFNCLKDICTKDQIISQNNSLKDFCYDQPYICPSPTSKPFTWDSKDFWKLKFNYRQWASTKSNGVVNNYIFYVYDLPFGGKHISIWTKVDLVTYVVGAEIIDKDWKTRDTYGLVPCVYLKGQRYDWL